MKDLTAIILAAGKGTRMKADLPKVAFPCAGTPMVRWVADACRDAGCSRIIVVVGYQQDVVRTIFEHDRSIEFAVQAEQLGTGHAVLSAAPLFAGRMHGDALVLAGDGPLIRAETLRRLADLRRSASAAAVLGTTTLDDPTGYGRIVRDSRGRFERIVEQKNAAPAHLKITEVYPSLCCFDTALLFSALRALPRDVVSGEYYITQVPEMLASTGEAIELMPGIPPEEAMGVNTPEQLAHVEQVLLKQRGGRPHAGAGARA